MTLVLLASTEDPAGANIKQQLFKLKPWNLEGTIFEHNYYTLDENENIFLITIPDRTIFHDNVDKEIIQHLGIHPTQIIVLSRHSSKAEKPSLTVHPIGNYYTAEFGGKTTTLVPSLPRSMTELLHCIKPLAQQAGLSYDVCFEVTHHGPYLETPTLYVEVGSTEKQWSDPVPAQIIATSVLQLLDKAIYEHDMPDDIPVYIGIGGGHYAPRFTDIIFEKRVAFGHMIPSYHTKPEHITKEMLAQAIAKTPNVSGVYLHKKYLKKSHVTKFKTWCEELHIPVVSSTLMPLLS